MLLWASQVAVVVKYCLSMQETRVRSLGWEDLLEEKPVDRGAWHTTVHEVAESDMTEQLNTHTNTHRLSTRFAFLKN